MKRKLRRLFGFALLLSFHQPLQATDIGPDDFGYVATDSVGFNWYDMSTGTQLLLNDDELSYWLPLGFSFDYYGSTHDSVCVASNGFLLFDLIDYQLFQGTQCPLPSPGVVDGLAAFYHRDLNPTDPSCTGDCGIYYASGGPEGDRWFGVTFEQVPQWHESPDVPDPVTVQIILFENNNRILVQVEEAGTSEGGDASIGIESPDGLSGLSWPGCLTSGSVTDNMAILFTRDERIFSDGFESEDTSAWSNGH